MKIFQNKSIRHILIITFIIAVIVPISLMGYLSVYIFKDNLEEEISQKNYSLSLSLASAVEEYLSQSDKLLEEIKWVLQRELISYSLVYPYLFTAYQNYTFFNKIQVVDKKGIVNYQVPYDENSIGKNLSKSEFYTDWQAEHKTFWSSAFISEKTSGLTITISKTYDEGQVIGYLDLAKLYSIIDRAEVGNKGYAGIIDQKGALLAQTEKDKNKKELYDISNLKFIDKALQEKGGTYNYFDKYQKENMLASVAIVKQTGWPVVVAQSQEEAFIVIEKIYLFFALGLAIAVLVAFLIVRKSIDNILSPLYELASSTESVVAGNYDSSLDIGGFREINELAGDFRQMITEVLKREEKLKKSLEEKELLLREVHHRVKNNLQIITSLLRLQARETTDENAAWALLESENRIKSIGMVHNQLYRSEKMADVDFYSYVKKLTTDLLRAYGFNQGNIFLDIKIQASLSIEKAIPCGLIINELVSNSLKYAFDPDEEGEIIIYLQYNNRQYKLTVGDTGRGIPELDELKKKESLGLELVQTLARDQLNGEIKIEREEGTKFIISFR